MSGVLFQHSYEEMISLENLLEAWQEFVMGKRSRQDVQIFELSLMENLISLHRRLADFSYRHDAYEAFTVSDPKSRRIHKATVSDRVLHRAIYRELYPYFDRTFIADSFSCRNDKGTHKALERFRVFAGRASHNHRRTAWVLKGDIRKFFASVDQTILLRILDGPMQDKRIVWLIKRVVRSFDSGQHGIGLPLGNLTSQLFANVYLNEFDQFVKQFLCAKCYLRYADDFIFLSEDRRYLLSLLPLVNDFLRERLGLELHPGKIFLKSVASGVDFLGWVHFSDHRVLRTTTKRRMFRTLGVEANESKLASYKGLLQHGNAKILKAKIERGIELMEEVQYLGF